MDWIAWSLLLLSTAFAATTHLLRPAKKPTPARVLLTISSLGLAITAAVLASIAWHQGSGGNLPLVLVVIASVAFAVGSGSPYTELVFHLAANQQAKRATTPSAESPLRGGLWIGLLERTAIVSTLWASWPEGIAIVLAIKGLGRFSELKNHKAAEQFILGTFSSALCACAAYGIGLLLVG
ncbi:hypothetical protein OK351_05050 [Glutamicibacter sp. MNS18]|uniref:hypothetical protein n=1 Tax=Glutamicibacter sp. MNS18 TaxID=2989817 RepID=UPI002236B230|nr:hypothetical protein [Glutamicibacter sp. MNS18]MCW4464873.1 hypothetical protein [Glutamicibacter sp. MNS18]